MYTATIEDQDILLRSLRRAGGTLVSPVLVLLAAFFAGTRIASVEPGLQQYFVYLPYVFYGVGLALAWRFNRSRVFFMGLLLLGVHYVLSSGQVLVPEEASQSMHRLMTIFIPVNFLILALLKERGIFSRHGGLRLGIIVIQAAAVYFMLTWQPGWLSAILGYEVVPLQSVRSLSLPQVAIPLVVVALTMLGIQLINHPSAVTASAAGAFMAAILAMIYSSNPMVCTLFLAAGGFMIVLGLVQDSYFMAYHDELTGLPGRRALTEDMLKLGGTYTLSMIDIDYFKKFNDRFGHDVGDQVLRFIAAKLAATRGGAKVYRFGGEEFTILFPGKSVWEAEPHLLEVHAAVEKSRFILRAKNRPKTAPSDTSQFGDKKKNRRVKITVSVGVAEKKGDHASAEAVMKQADEALYRAKEKGRNRICF